MKLNKSYFYTLRENVKDEDSTSGNLLVRSGMVKKSSSGVYMYLPLGFKVLKKIENIVREEMNAAGAQEVLMPSLIPEEVYIASGRREGFGSSMFSLKDRFNKPFVLGPTHEELFAAAAAMHIKSYKDMPINLYQFQTKFRDEPRPRFGLIRVREFIMKDAYSFDTDVEGLNKSYQLMFDAYKNSFDRMKIDYKIVTADTGVMGGMLSEEFQAVTDIGEDILVLCDSCGYSSNLEVAVCVSKEPMSNVAFESKELVFTPKAKTIEEVSGFFGLPVTQFVKTLIYVIDHKPVAVMVRGDHEVNETKVRKLVGGSSIELAPAAIVEDVTKAAVGFAGPVGLTIDVIADNEVVKLRNFIVGANQTDHHFKNVNISDFNIKVMGDIRQIKDGDRCPNCTHHVHFKHGIEIGNTFKLGDKYSKVMNLEYLDAANQLHPVVMGSYGIGPGRCLAALAEQKHDEFGVKWPMAVAPFEVAIIIINLKIEKQVQVGNDLYQQFKDSGVDVVLDDRDERAGVKFNDMDLLGVPLRITVGKTIEQDMVELKVRGDKESKLVPVSDVLAQVQSMIKEQLSK
jgi:prolyl-tRNA synthetase